MGCASVTLATHAVAGLPSKADKAWSCGSPVYVEDAVTRAWTGLSRTNLSASAGSSGWRSRGAWPAREQAR